MQFNSGSACVSHALAGVPRASPAGIGKAPFGEERRAPTQSARRRLERPGRSRSPIPTASFRLRRKQERQCAPGPEAPVELVVLARLRLLPLVPRHPQPFEVRLRLEEGKFGGGYQREDSGMLGIWDGAVAEKRTLLENW